MESTAKWIVARVNEWKKKTVYFFYQNRKPYCKVIDLVGTVWIWNTKWRLINIEDRVISDILPKDGTVNYYCKIVTLKEINQYLELLLQNILWKKDRDVIFGIWQAYNYTIIKVAWYGDSNNLYTYSNTTKQKLGWLKILSELKQVVEEQTETKFNSCLLNLYHDGNEGMAWYSDDEKALGKITTIASLRFGANENFHSSISKLSKRFHLFLNVIVCL